MKNRTKITGIILLLSAMTFFTTCKKDDGPSTIAVTGISVSPGTLTLTAGENATLNFTITPGDASNTAVMWSSDNQAVATVDQNGGVTAIAGGTAVVTAQTADGVFTGTSTITVAVPTLNSISPTSGPKTTIVTFNGSNFGTDDSVVTVFFNDVEAEVQSVANDKITALVPARAFSGVVKVIIDGTNLIGPEFSYIISDVQVSTLAGSTQGFVDGMGSSAQFDRPRGAAVDELGNVYVVDYNHKIRKITPSGAVSTLAGSTPGFADGTGLNAQFSFPEAVAVDAEGNVYVADSGNNKIRKITPSGVVSTLAGGTQGFANGTGVNAQFDAPFGVAVDVEGNVYVSDFGNHKIRKITPSGVVSTLAGNNQGFADGTGANAQFHFPYGVAVDAEGNVYVADSGNHKLRMITPGGAVSTLAGSTTGFTDGTGANAKFDFPLGVAVDAEGNVYVGDNNRVIRKITPSGAVSTLAGSTGGFADGTGANARFDGPHGVAVDEQGNIFVADSFNHKIRKITQE